MGSHSVAACTGKRVVVTAFGSLGDLHPYLAIALGLKVRGHKAVVATSDCYRRKVEALGLGFRTLRPDSTFVDDPAVMRLVMDPRTGLEHVLRRVILPAVRDSYEDTLAAAEGADLLVSHPLCFAARLVAETTGTAWASTMVTPLGLASAYDPPSLPGYPGLSMALRPLGPAFWGPLRWLLKRATRPWARPLDRLRAELGLSPAVDHPPDNAARLARLGVARIVYPRRYTPARAAAELGRLLDDPSYSQRALEVGGRVGREDGVAVACDALESLLSKGGRPR